VALHALLTNGELDAHDAAFGVRHLRSAGAVPSPNEPI
jgi:hypothetical protein